MNKLASVRGLAGEQPMAGANDCSANSENASPAEGIQRDHDAAAADSVHGPIRGSDRSAVVADESSIKLEKSSHQQ